MKRLNLAIILGGVLGIFCIIGVGARIGYSGNEIFLFATWYNRVVMGIMIGLADKIKLNPLIRGGIIGLIVSLAWFLTSGLLDTMGFIAGIIYGIIIDYISTKWGK